MAEGQLDLEHLLQDRAFLRRALLAGGQGNVLQIGKYNVRIEQGENLQIGDRIYQGPDLETLRRVVREVQAEIAADRYTASLQDYFRALRAYCASLPYLTLTGIRPPKNLDEVYVPLQARRRGEVQEQEMATQGSSLSIAEVLRQTQAHLLILGQPGAGKSTLLRQLAERAYDDPQSIGLERPHLPLLLPLRALARAEGALEERLNRALRNELSPHLTRALPDGFFDAWPQQLDAPWLFLLDGLDEVPGGNYLSLKAWLEDLLARAEIARIIITSRPFAETETERGDSRFGVYEIQPFTPKQTAELARRWFGENVTVFLEALKNMRSGVLEQTPLLLTIATKVYLERGRLPERRARLYQKFVDILLEEARQHGLGDELDAAVIDLAQSTLAHIALAMTDHPEWVDEASLTPVVARYLDEQLNLKDRAETVARRFLRVMARRSGVFFKREGKYEWVHSTFREYFVALALNQSLARKTFDEVLEERIWRDEWKEPIVFLSELYEQARDMVIWLVKHAKKTNGATAYLAWRCWKASKVQISDGIRSDMAKALISSFRLHGPASFFAALVVGEVLDASSTKQLIVMLSDQDESVCTLAAMAVRSLGDPRAVNPLINLLKNKIAVKDVIDALVAIGIPAVKPLIRLLSNADPDVRFHVANALGQIGDIRAVPALVGLLRDENSWVAASNGLVRIGPAAVEPLIRLFYCTEEDLRKNIRHKVGDTWLADLLLPSLAYADWDLGWRVVLTLEKIGTPAVEPLIAALSNPNEGIRWGAAITLGRIGDVRAAQSLANAVCDPNLNVALSAVESLGKIGSAAVEPLIRLLQTLSWKAPHQRIIDAFKKIGPPAVEPLIIALSNTSDIYVRNTIIDTLGEIGDDRAIEPIVSILGKNCSSDFGLVPSSLFAELIGYHSSTCEHAIHVLVKIGAPAVDALISALSNSNPSVREFAALALGKIGDRRAIKPLIDLLSDQEKRVCMRAAEALGIIGDPVALPELERLARESTSPFDFLPFFSVAGVAREAVETIRRRMT